LGEKTVLICAGGEASFYKSGAFATLNSAIGRSDLNAPRFENIPPEPDTDCVRSLVRKMEEEQPEVVLAIGGGSVMDAAKAAYLSWQTGLDVNELFGNGVASKKFPSKQFRRVWCLPTTSGTGSEVTPYSNIIDKDNGVKCLIVEPEIIPEFAFVYPEFTCKVPQKITVDTALDAMVHCIESLLNVKAGKAHPEAASWAIMGISLIRDHLPLLLNGDPENPLLRSALSAAACLGGMCIKVCPTSLPHLCSFSFCGKTTHGEAVAALLPHFWRYYLSDPEIVERTLLLSRIFPGTTAAEVVDSCEKFIRSVGVETAPGTLSGTDLSFIDQLAENAKLNPVKLATAPIPIDPESAGKVFHQVLDSSWTH
jgi:alcohol dehydrogenase class IV